MPDTSSLDTNFEREGLGDKFSSAVNQAKDKAADAVHQAKEKASEMSDMARNKAQELGDTATRKIDEKRYRAAGALEDAATTIHQKAEAGGQSISSAGHSAANSMQATANYLRAHDTQQMMADVENVVRAHPGRSLAVAAALGFLVGRAFRND